MDFLQKHKGLWLRGALCFSIGAALLYFGDNDQYDSRFRIRGEQKPSKDIVLVLISQDEWIHLHGQKRNWIRPLKEITHLTDGFFWNPETWSNLLTQVLAGDPAIVAISFYFGNNIRRPLSKYIFAPEFKDQRLIWAARQDNDSQLLAPVFATSFSTNVGLNELEQDNDGIVRHFSSPYLQTPNLGLKIAQRFHPKRRKLQSQDFTEPRAINYQGSPGSYQSISLTDALKGKFPADFFTDKVVIIGSSDASGHIYQTPLGKMSRAEILATIADNGIHNKWIRRLGFSLSAPILLTLLAFGVWVMSTYPQAVALVFFFWSSVLISSLSLWIFDSFFFWTPIMAPVGQLVVTYIVFLSFQLTLKDNLNWRLEQERKYLLEVEELKHNFVSLISHDLKTPIAKIQAICDRLISTHQGSEPELTTDLVYLRKESAELHRYIQSILQITRVESRDFKINKQASDVNEIIEAVTGQLDPLAREKSIFIDVDLEPMFLIELDGILIHEVILNLVENAIKYTLKGGSIQVSSREVNDRVYVEVADTGTGISHESQQKIFDKFYRSEEGESLASGSGLGLYLVKYFIELHGGEITLESELNKGTKIGFWLPVKEESGTDKALGGVPWKTELKPS